MSNALVAAAATGLPMSRRLFLGRAGTIAAAASVPMAAAPAAAFAAPAAGAALARALTAAREGETPELLQIGVDLIAAKRCFADAESALDAAKARALAADPSIPDGLPVPFGISIFGCGSWQLLPNPTDILGNQIELPRYAMKGKGKSLPVKIPRSVDIVNARRHTMSVASWHQGEYRRLYDLATAYEAEIEHVRDVSGLGDAENEHVIAGAALVTLCRAATAIDAQTLAGVIIKAQAIDACADVSGESSRSAVWLASSHLPFELCSALGRAK